MKIETPILRRLGPVPFWRGETKCLDELERIYRRARTAAAAMCGDFRAASAQNGCRNRQSLPSCACGESLEARCFSEGTGILL